MRKVIGVGETILDIIFKNNQPQLAQAGGSVFNAFVTLGRMNIPLCFVSEVGNDKVGDIILDFMEANNIPSQYVGRFPEGKSPLAIAFLNDKNEAEYLFYKDSDKQRLETTLPDIQEDDIFIFGSYYALNPALRERISELLSLAKQRKAIIYYDPNFRNAHAHETVKLRPAILENFEYADIIRGSADDFRNIFNENNTDRIFNEHIKFYCQRLIITNGGESPVVVYDQSQRMEYPTKNIAPLSSIGAGDNFNAGIIYALLQHNIKHSDLSSLSNRQWTQIIAPAIDLATQACMSHDNYISAEFAKQYISQTI
ncbi:MAG: carbohydrate kinase [Tannerellaceae bacterium]|jgi:fructokinase|nr:carbohydrate kinase [Tannerellaceae bacterium]